MSAKTTKGDFIIKLLFVLLVFLLPTQIAYHFWPHWAFIFGIRVDYFSPALYLTDILTACLFLLVAVSAEKKNFYKKIKKMEALIFGVIIFVFVNVYFSLSPPLALYKWLKFFEMAGLVWFVAAYKKLDFKEWFLKPLFYSAIPFSLIGLFQFMKSATIGFPLNLLGERSFDVSTPGIALATINGKDYLRAYSTFPHPNALAGFLGIVLILLFFFRKKINKGLFIVTGALALSCLLLTFSLGAFLSLVVVLVLAKTVLKKYRNYIFVISLLVLLLSFSFLFLAKWLIVLFPSSSHVGERLFLDTVAKALIKSRPLFGVGIGNFVVGLNMLRLGISSWLLQPVHNIFLLVTSEVGIVGFLLFFLIVSKSLLKASFPLALCILFFLLTGMADHYWLTLQQNLLLISLVLGFSLRRNLRLL